MSLRKPLQIQRRAAGAWTAGRWVPGALGAPETILASVQPATLSDYDKMEPLLEGRRVESIQRVYTDIEMAQADVVLWRGAEYEVVDVSPWQSGIISHFRYLAARIVPERTQ